MATEKLAEGIKNKTKDGKETHCEVIQKDRDVSHLLCEGKVR
jgi:hypothetical protein